jgi:DNA-directed RNA polymerase alpha subunit
MLQGTVTLVFDDGSEIALKVPRQRRLVRVHSDLGDGVELEVRRAPPLPLPRGLVLHALLDLRLEDCELSVRATNAMFNMKLNYVGELVQKQESILLKSRHVTRKVLDEVKEMLHGLRLSIGMLESDLDGWSRHAR